MRAGGQRFWAETTLSALRDDAGTLARLRQGHARPDREPPGPRPPRIDRRAQSGGARATPRRRAARARRVARSQRWSSATLVAAWSPSASRRRARRHVRGGRRRLGPARDPRARRLRRSPRSPERARTESVSDLQGRSSCAPGARRRRHELGFVRAVARGRRDVRSARRR